MEVPATALHGFSAKLWMELRHATEQELPRMTDAWVPLTAIERHMDVSRDWLLHTVLNHPDHFVYHVDEDVPDRVKASCPSIGRTLQLTTASSSGRTWRCAANPIATATPATIPARRGC